MIGDSIFVAFDFAAIWDIIATLLLEKYPLLGRMLMCSHALLVGIPDPFHIVRLFFCDNKREQTFQS